MKKTTTTQSDKHARPIKPQAQPKTDTATLKLIRELTTTQAELANLVSDAIMNGAERYNIETIIRGALLHKWATMFPKTNNPKEDFEKREEKQDQFADLWTERRYLDLVRSWPEASSPKEEHPRSTAVVELARANVRAQLRFNFESFIGQADPESVFFLNEVLLDFIMNFNGHTGSPVAECFGRQIDSDSTFLKVPDEHVERVKDFLALITSKKEAA